MQVLPSKATIRNTKIPATTLGLGTSPLGNMFTLVEEFDSFNTLEAAWEAGARIFDTAPLYGSGLAERRLGDFLRTKNRDEYILINKVGRMLVPRRETNRTEKMLRSKSVADQAEKMFISNMPFSSVFDYSYDAAMRSYEDSLQRMGLDRFDIILVHDVGVAEHGDRQQEVFKEAIDGASKAMFELRDQGEIDAVGMGTNEWQVAEAALKAADFDTFLLAGRYTLLEQQAAETFLPLCLERNISVVLGGVFNSGLLVTENTEKATWNHTKAPAEFVERALQLKSICVRHDLRLPAAAIHFALAHPAVASIVIGMRSPKQAKEVFEWAKQDLPSGLWRDFVCEGLLSPDLPIPAEI